MRCSAKSKRSGERCKKDAVKGREVCHIHGGKSLAGTASPSWKDGSRSKYRPVFSDEQLEHFEALIKSGRYLELGEDIAAIDTLVLVELKRAKVGEGGHLWRELRDVWRGFDQAQRGGDMGAAARHLSRVGRLITEGTERRAALDEVKDLLERKRKLAESERRRLAESQQMIHATQALAFAAALNAVVKRHVRDPAVLTAIGDDIARIVHDHRIEGRI